MQNSKQDSADILSRSSSEKSEKEDRMAYRARFHLAEIINYARKRIFIKLYSMPGSKLLKEFSAIG